MMEFTEGRPEQYAFGAQLLAYTARSLGAPVTESVVDGWRRTAWLMSSADDATEVGRGLQDGAAVLDLMELPPDIPELSATAEQLLDTVTDEQRATTLKEYFAARTRQGQETAHIFRYLPVSAAFKDDASLWRELSKLVTLATHLDTMMDCRLDAIASGRFTAPQLALGGLAYSARTARHVQKDTWRAFREAAHNTGAKFSLVKRIITKPFMSPEQYDHWILGC